MQSIMGESGALFLENLALLGAVAIREVEYIESKCSNVVPAKAGTHNTAASIQSQSNR
jgi:hypothetical protein